jgi:hypothetical protein
VAFIDKRTKKQKIPLVQSRSTLPCACTMDTAEKDPAVAAMLSPTVTRLICSEIKDNATQRK